ncbi:MAG: hypothetical protein ACTS3R_16175 [Inquilinaceae bacterium]
MTAPADMRGGWRAALRRRRCLVFIGMAAVLFFLFWPYLPSRPHCQWEPIMEPLGKEYAGEVLANLMSFDVPYIYRPGEIRVTLWDLWDDDQWVGNSHYKPQYYLYRERLEAGVVPDSMIPMSDRDCDTIRFLATDPPSGAGPSRP